MKIMIRLLKINKTDKDSDQNIKTYILFEKFKKLVDKIILLFDSDLNSNATTWTKNFIIIKLVNFFGFYLNLLLILFFYMSLTIYHTNRC